MTEQTTPAPELDVEATPDEAARVQRILGYCDGWADLWAAENDIEDQLRRIMSGAGPDWIALMLKWTKLCYGEGCYDGFKQAQAIAKSAIIGRLESQLAAAREEIERLKADCVFWRTARNEFHDELIDARRELSALRESASKEAGDIEIHRAMAGALVIMRMSADDFREALAKSGLRIVRSSQTGTL